MPNETKPDNNATAPEHGSETACAEAPSSNHLPAHVAELVQHPQSRSLTITQGDICFIVIMSGFVASVTARPRREGDPTQSLVIVEFDPTNGCPEPTSIN